MRKKQVHFNMTDQETELFEYAEKLGQQAGLYLPTTKSVIMTALSIMIKQLDANKKTKKHLKLSEILGGE